MATVDKSVLVAHSARQMFDLVDRCEDYSQFLPWCGGAQVHKRDEKTTHATIYIDYRGIKAHFTTDNAKEVPSLMTIHLCDGPFRTLNGHWRFTPLTEAACKVEFRLHYEFANRLLEKLIGPIFNHIANTFIEAFVKRADQIHG